MKNLLIPIDFSDNAQKALEFAFMLADGKGGKITVVHIEENEPADDQVEQIKEDMWLFCQKLRDQLDVREVYYEVKVIVGKNILVLNDPKYLSEIDMVVMGTRGASSGVSSLVGSNTVNLMEKINKPLLIIPNEAEYQEIKNIFFCSDYKQTNLEFTLKPLKEIAMSVGAMVRFGHIKTNREAPKASHVEESRVEGAFLGPEVKYNYKLIHAPNVYEGINYYLDLKGDIQMIAMVNRRHGFFDRLFRTNNTVKMAYHTTLPLLVLAE